MRAKCKADPLVPYASPRLTTCMVQNRINPMWKFRKAISGPQFAHYISYRAETISVKIHVKNKEILSTYMLSSWGWQAFASPGILPDLYIQLTKLVNLLPHRSKEIVHLSGLHIENRQVIEHLPSMNFGKQKFV